MYIIQYFDKGTFYTKCATYLDEWSDIIICESLLATFEASIVFEAAGSVVKICSSLKPNRQMQIEPS